MKLLQLLSRRRVRRPRREFGHEWSDFRSPDAALVSLEKRELTRAFNRLPGFPITANATVLLTDGAFFNSTSTNYIDANLAVALGSFTQSNPFTGITTSTNIVSTSLVSDGGASANGAETLVLSGAHVHLDGASCEQASGPAGGLAFFTDISTTFAQGTWLDQMLDNNQLHIQFQMDYFPSPANGAFSAAALNFTITTPGEQNPIFAVGQAPGTPPGTLTLTVPQPLDAVGNPLPAISQTLTAPGALNGAAAVSIFVDVFVPSPGIFTVTGASNLFSGISATMTPGNVIQANPQLHWHGTILD